MKSLLQSDSDYYCMDNITIQFSAEQIALLNKLLTPYVEMYQQINQTFKTQAIQQSQIGNKETQSKE